MKIEEKSTLKLWRKCDFRSESVAHVLVLFKNWTSYSGFVNKVEASFGQAINQRLKSTTEESQCCVKSDMCETRYVLEYCMSIFGGTTIVMMQSTSLSKSFSSHLVAQGLCRQA
ncbi:hypothetical protein GQX74_013705 [Glossina fuscipes]|nr:hypothetical protein GQX74_013705 [Glossina fuscipes]